MCHVFARRCHHISRLPKLLCSGKQNLLGYKRPQRIASVHPNQIKGRSISRADLEPPSNLSELRQAFVQCHNISGHQMQALKDADPEVSHSPEEFLLATHAPWCSGGSVCFSSNCTKTKLQDFGYDL